MLYIEMKSGAGHIWHIGQKLPIQASQIYQVSYLQVCGHEKNDHFIPPYLHDKLVVKISGDAARAYLKSLLPEQKEYTIPFMYSKMVNIKVLANNLQDALNLATKEFLSIPDEGYLDDSFEVDSVLEDNYPDEDYSLEVALKNI